MKRNLLAVVIPALLVAGSANASIELYNKNGNKVNFFGEVKAANYITKHGNEDGDHSKINFGFDGYTTITENLAGYAKYQYEVKLADGNGNNKAKYAYVGLDFGNAGQFDYGRNNGVLKAITAYTDVLPEFGGDASNNDFYVLSDRGTGVATYTNKNFFGAVEGLSIALQYADKVGETESYTAGGIATSEMNNGNYGREAYGLNAQYTILDTGFTIGAGYATTSKSDKEYGPDAKRAQSYMVGANYDANNLYVGALFAYGKNIPLEFERYNSTTNAMESDDSDKKIKGYELVVKYGVDLDIGRITPSLAYVQHKGKPKNGDYVNLVKYVDVGFAYDFNKNLTAIVDYKINLLKEDNGYRTKAQTKDTLGLGLVYKF